MAIIWTFLLKTSNLLKFGTVCVHKSVMTHYRGLTYANGTKYLKMTVNMVKHDNPVTVSQKQKFINFAVVVLVFNVVRCMSILFVTTNSIVFKYKRDFFKISAVHFYTYYGNNVWT